MNTVIGTAGLIKRLRLLRAVDGIDLDVREGDVYGFLGANGSGKTTTVRMLLGLVLPTSGDDRAARPAGCPRRPAGAPRVGALIEGPAAYGHLSGRANLSLLDAPGPAVRRTRRPGSPRCSSRSGSPASAAGRSRPTRWACGSGWGWPARCCAVPELLVLDEPTNGLDPQGIREVRDLLLALHRAGRRSSSPATCWPRWSSCAPGSACSTAAGWCCRTSWPR